MTHLANTIFSKIKKISFTLTLKIHSLHSFKYVSIKLAVPVITGNLYIIPQLREVRGYQKNLLSAFPVVTGSRSQRLCLTVRITSLQLLFIYWSGPVKCCFNTFPATVNLLCAFHAAANTIQVSSRTPRYPHKKINRV